VTLSNSVDQGQYLQCVREEIAPMTSPLGTNQILELGKEIYSPLQTP
jgi:hypothetical protein